MRDFKDFLSRCINNFGIKCPKDDFLQILFYDSNQVDHKMMLGPGGGFLSNH